MRCFLFVTLFLFAQNIANSAACCAGGASFPSLILSDDKAQLGVSASFSKVIGDAPNSGKPVFRNSSDDEWIHTYTLDAARLLSDRWQIGTAIPVVYRTRSNNAGKASDWGVGDMSAMLGFEALPEYSYSKWKPRGFLFTQFTVPTGGNTYESKKTFEVDAHGKGFYSLSIGTFLIKTIRSFDFSFRFSYLYSLPRTFKDSNGIPLKVSPGQSYSTALSAGYSPQQSDWRFALSLNPTYTTINNSSDYKLVWTTSLDISKIIYRRWVMGLGYNDQTLIGPANNSSLERGVVSFIRYKWER